MEDHGFVHNDQQTQYSCSLIVILYSSRVRPGYKTKLRKPTLIDYSNWHNNSNKRICCYRNSHFLLICCFLYFHPIMNTIFHPYDVKTVCSSVRISICLISISSFTTIFVSLFIGTGSPLLAIVCCWVPIEHTKLIESCWTTGRVLFTIY